MTAGLKFPDCDFRWVNSGQPPPTGREFLNGSSPAALSEHTVSLLEELAKHGCGFAASQIVGIPAVLSFLAETVHEIPAKGQNWLATWFKSNVKRDGTSRTSGGSGTDIVTGSVFTTFATATIPRSRRRAACDSQDWFSTTFPSPVAALLAQSISPTQNTTLRAQALLLASVGVSYSSPTTRRLEHFFVFDVVFLLVQSLIGCHLNNKKKNHPTTSSD